MSFVKKNGPLFVQLGWLTGLVFISCAAASCNTAKQVEAYQEIQRSVGAVDAKIEAMVEVGGGKFVPAPIRPERQG